jgi:hypothetical protein
MKNKLPLRIPFMAAALLLALALSTPCPAWSADPAGAAEKEAKTWLRLVDKGDYLASWKEAGEYFQKGISADKWGQTIYSGRAPLGQAISRQLATAKAHRTMPGAPDGEYYVLLFKSSFTSKRKALETVTLVKEPERGWRVVGYYVK